MKLWGFAPSVASAACLVLAAPAVAEGEKEAAVRSGAPAAPAGWSVSRTPWGDPDLRGTWPLDAVGQTPVERPVELGAKAYFTDEEYRAAVLDRLDIPGNPKEIPPMLAARNAEPATQISPDQGRGNGTGGQDSGTNNDQRTDNIS